MKGLSIGRAELGPRSRSVPGILTDFEDYFASIYPTVRGYRWFLADVVLAIPESEIVEKLASRGGQSIVGPGFLERYARFLVDDWCDIISVDPAADPEAVLLAYAARTTALELESLQPSPEVAFFCIDAARWEIFARQEGLLNQVRERLDPRGDLVVREISLAESVG